MIIANNEKRTKHRYAQSNISMSCQYINQIEVKTLANTKSLINPYGQSLFTSGRDQRQRAPIGPCASVRARLHKSSDTQHLAPFIILLTR